MGFRQGRNQGKGQETFEEDETQAARRESDVHLLQSPYGLELGENGSSRSRPALEAGRSALDLRGGAVPYPDGGREAIPP